MKLSILLFSILISFNSYGEWIKYGESAAGDSYYINSDKINRFKDSVTFQSLANYKEVGIYGGKSSISKTRADCSTYKARVESFSSYRFEMGRGHVEEYKPSSKMEVTPRNSIMGLAIDLACDFEKSKLNPINTDGEWIKLGKNAGGDTYYINIDKINKHKDSVTFRMMADYLEQQTWGKSAITFRRANCNTYKYKDESFYAYHQQMAKGNPVKYTPRDEFRQVPKNHVISLAITYACNFDKKGKNQNIKSYSNSNSDDNDKGNTKSQKPFSTIYIDSGSTEIIIPSPEGYRSYSKEDELFNSALDGQIGLQGLLGVESLWIALGTNKVLSLGTLGRKYEINLSSANFSKLKEGYKDGELGPFKFFFESDNSIGGIIKDENFTAANVFIHVKQKLLILIIISEYKSTKDLEQIKQTAKLFSSQIIEANQKGKVYKTTDTKTSSDYKKDLETIKDLLDSGLINKEDYEKQKQKILDRI